MLQRVYFSLNSPPHHCTANSYLYLWGELVWGHRTILLGTFDVKYQQHNVTVSSFSPAPIYCFISLPIKDSGGSALPSPCKLPKAMF